ncbi:ABC transporter permease [Dyadobacter subterraneus]|uniref:ABC transporter permease n=1 Tax=Dyadobacter subterraneus TaxID=2773304 RepID=A0ABR9WBB1_9BACT|nr:ABC transporter permease [Dyadobacter subterraneus]MBE9462271.1 ABC transporter permease [Dyadobacter subterraneus]
MLRNYLKIAYRNLSQNKGYSALTIFGLALGLTVSLLSILYVKDELAYDHFNKKSDRIYRINSDITYSGKSAKGALAPTPMGQTLKQDFPEIEEFTRLGKYDSQIVKSEQSAIREEGILYADSTVFDVFTLPLLSGNPQKALAGPNSVVISRRIANKYFGTTNALNKILTFNTGEVRRVTGVMEDMPEQSHFHADILLPLYETRDAKVNKWGNHIFNTYVLLKSGTTPKSVEAKFEKILQTYLDPALKQYFQTSLAETRKAGNNFSYSLMPLTDIHLYSDREGELSPNSSIQYIYIFLLTGLFILVIAVFNFINLTTARSAKRAREVGVRKVMGSDRSVLVFQFLSESLLTTFLALAAGLLLLYLLIPGFNNLAAKHLSITSEINLFSILYLLAGTTLVSIIAGIYPAFYLSSFQPVKALKGILIQSKSQGFRNSLVTFQFALSVLLIIGTLLVNQQLQYIQTKRIGFDKDQVVVINTAQSTKSQVLTFKSAVLQTPSVKSGTVSGFLPVTSRRWNDMWYPQQETDAKYSVNMQEWMVDPDYVSTLRMEIIAGRDFIAGRTTDSSAVIINESAAKQFGLKNPIGKIIHKTGGEQLTVIGVVKDFHYESLRSKIAPVGLVINGNAIDRPLEKSFLEAVSFRLNPADVKSSLAEIEKKWKEIAPGQPFEYSFLNEDFDAMYRSEQRIGQLFTAFSGIAILIACLGLFGLSSFSAEQRTKEIGVRKVLGASVSSIVSLLSKDFLKPVLTAILIAAPIGWYGMQIWLQDFAYKIEIHWWTFAIAGLSSLFIALLTVSFQSIKAALMNPVKSLKSE